MKYKQLKSTSVYNVRDACDPTGANYQHKGIYNFHSAAIALYCIVALMDKHGTKRDDYVIIEVRKTESLVVVE